ncbi:hypothetical protein L1887_57834 [Cichorium endivia]|nr:hypothetical protein L1887_57834 [Cichorium endivia]
MRFELLRRFARWSGHDDLTVMDWHAPAAGYSHARSSQGADCFRRLGRILHELETVSGWHQSVCGASGEEGARETGTRRRAGGSGVVECLSQWKEDHADHEQARQATIVSEAELAGEVPSQRSCGAASGPSFGSFLQTKRSRQRKALRGASCFSGKEVAQDDGSREWDPSADGAGRQAALSIVARQGVKELRTLGAKKQRAGCAEGLALP